QALETERRVAQERDRISRDLHDHLGSEVSTVLAGLELAQLPAVAGGTGRVHDYLGTLRDHAHRIMAQLHETVWSLRSERVTVSAFAERVAEHVRERQRYVATPRLHCATSGDTDAELSGAQALHLFRFTQEALSNAVRHAGAANVRVGVH